MIPLSLWLAERHPPQDTPFMAVAAEARAIPAISPGEEEPRDGGAVSTQREEALILALKEAEEKLQQLLLMQAERERELELRLGEELGGRLRIEIHRSVEGLLETIEESLAQVLTPFLDERTRLRAVAELTELIRSEVQRSDLPVLEIRAPVHFHEGLRGISDGANTPIALVPSEIIEVVLAAERRRFEDLSARWLKAIEGVT